MGLRGVCGGGPFHSPWPIPVREGFPVRPSADARPPQGAPERADAPADACPGYFEMGRLPEGRPGHFRASGHRLTFACVERDSASRLPYPSQIVYSAHWPPSPSQNACSGQPPPSLPPSPWRFACNVPFAVARPQMSHPGSDHRRQYGQGSAEREPIVKNRRGHRSSRPVPPARREVSRGTRRDAAKPARSPTPIALRMLHAAALGCLGVVDDILTAGWTRRSWATTHTWMVATNESGWRPALIGFGWGKPARTFRSARNWTTPRFAPFARTQAGAEATFAGRLSCNSSMTPRSKNISCRRAISQPTPVEKPGYSTSS